MLIFSGWIISKGFVKIGAVVCIAPLARKGVDMENHISDETMDYVGILAKLTLTSQEKSKARKEMEKMLTFFDMLKDLDTEGVKPMSHTFDLANVFREDVVTNGDDRKSILKNAPGEKKGMFQVPSTFE